MSATILLVEDDEIIRRLFGRVLRGGGYTVLEAGSGEAAEVLCRERNVDLVIWDVCIEREDRSATRSQPQTNGAATAAAV